MSFRVRLARPEDDAAIGDLLVEAFARAYARKRPDISMTDARREDLRDVKGRRQWATVLVLESEAQVAGTVSLLRFGVARSEAFIPGAADLRFLATAPGMHGRGLSAPLMDEAERLAREEFRAPAVCLHARRGIEGVARLYLARGYVREPSGDLAKPGVDLDGYALRF